jgi:hypothetical protein
VADDRFNRPVDADPLGNQRESIAPLIDATVEIYKAIYVLQQTITSSPRLPVYTVGTLPVAPTTGTVALVTDANATTFASAVAAGGVNIVPVYFNGTTWRIG